MLLKNLIHRKPLLPPPALGFQNKSLYSSSPLGRFETPLGQNLDTGNRDNFVYPFSQAVEIQNVKTSISSADEDVAFSSQSSESTNDILDKENQIASGSVNELQNDKLLLRAKQNNDNYLTEADIKSPSLTDFCSEQDARTTDINLQKSNAVENQELIGQNLNQDKASIESHVDEDSKDSTENKHLPEPLESLKPLAQSSDFYISRFVADYLSNKPGIYSSALLESQNQNVDNIVSDTFIDSAVNLEIENHQTTEKLQKSEISPEQQTNKIQTSLESSTPESFLKTDLSPKHNPIEFQLKPNFDEQSLITSETNFTKNNPEITAIDSHEIQTQPESLTDENLLNSPLSNYQEQASVNLKDTTTSSDNTSSDTQLSETEQVSENITPRDIPLQQKIVNLNLDSVNQNQQNSEQSNPVEQKPNIQNRVSQNINLDSNTSSEIPQKEAENINQTSSEQGDGITTVSENLNQHKLASPLSENTQIQTSISEETTNKSPEPGLKPSTLKNLETSPENFNQNIQKNQLSKIDTEKQNVTNNNTSLASLTSNSENNYQISESPLQTEKSELEATSEVIQPQLTNPNQPIENQITESKDLSQLSLKKSSSPQSLDNNSNIQSSQTEENISTNLPKSTSPEDISAEEKNNTLYPQIQVKSDLPTSITKTSSSNNFSESLPEKTNYSHLPPLSKLSPLVKESDIQLSRFVTNSNILATNPDHQLQPLTKPLEDGLNSENILPLPEEPQNNPNLNLKVSDSEQPINRSEKVNLFSSNNNLNKKPNQSPENIVNAKYQSDNIRPDNDSTPDSWSDISELIGDTSPTNISNKISNTTNENSSEDNTRNLSSTEKTNFKNNLFDNQNEIPNFSDLLEDNIEQPLTNNAEITNKFNLFDSQPLDSQANQNKQISQSAKSLGIQSNKINEEDLEIMSYQIYIIIRQKLEIYRECQGRSLLGYPDWLNMIPLNLSIGSYQKINQVDFLDEKMNLLAMEVYKLISFRLEAEQEICVR